MMPLAGLAFLWAAALPAEAQTLRVYAFDPPCVSNKLCVEPCVSVHQDIRIEHDSAWSVRLDEGVWRVTVELGSDQEATQTSILAEDHRLMAAAVSTKRGEFKRVSFAIHLRTPQLIKPPTNAPGGAVVRLSDAQASARNWDGWLTLAFPGNSAVRRIEIEAADRPTLFLVGDSLVADHREPVSAGWGQMLPALLDDGVAVANFAEGGATLKSFLAELRLDKVLEMLRPGDWVFIQFGHNDQKAHWPQTYAPAATTYAAYLRAYILEVKRLGGVPVLVTSPERRNFDSSGRIENSLGDYPDAVRSVARAEGVALIDLNQATRNLMKNLGPDRAASLFANNGRDRTHYNRAGAWVTARIVADAARRAVPSLAHHVTASALGSAAEEADLAHDQMDGGNEK